MLWKQLHIALYTGSHNFLMCSLKLIFLCNDFLGYFSKVVAAKKRNPGLKVMAAVGGWINDSEPFSEMAKSAATRKMFIDSVLKIMMKFDFDGLDLDWEYPSLRGGVAGDRKNFVLLIQVNASVLSKLL